MLTSSDEKKADDQKAEERERNTNFKGKDAVPLQKKADDSLSVLFGASANAGAAAKKPEPKKRAVVQRKLTSIVHIPDIFEQFESLGLKPPLSVDAIPASLKELENKLQYFKTAPAPPTKAEKDLLAKKAEKERQEKALNADLRAEEAIARKAVGKDVVNAEQQERKARVGELQDAAAATQAERAAAAKIAKAGYADEQARLDAEDEAEEAQRRIAASHNRKASASLAAVEQARRVSELELERNAADAEANAARSEARAKAAEAARLEQQRQIEERDALSNLAHSEEDRLRKEAIALANQLEEEEKRRRIAVEKAAQAAAAKEEKDLIKKVDQDMETERARRISEAAKGANEDSIERQRRRSVATEQEIAEQARRIASNPVDPKNAPPNPGTTVVRSLVDP